LFVAAGSYAGAKNTKFAVVRYGNVVGSRGSVIPFFLKTKKTGVLPITDERMTRFWITLDKGVQFVLDSLERMHGGEIFVPKIPSTTITDLAKAIAPECEIKIIGIRPGEKLHESMITRDDARHTLEYPTHYVIYPEINMSENDDKLMGKKLFEGFEYSSDNNTEWLSVEEIKQLISTLEVEGVEKEHVPAN
jgi:UDP-N-acetylglucosamine 4,6-dehydratase